MCNWTESSSYISVNSTGVVTGLDVGTATITVTDKITQISDSATVTVTIPLEGIYNFCLYTIEPGCLIHDHSTVIYDTKNALTANGYSNRVTVREDPVLSTRCRTDLKQFSVFTSSGHGSSYRYNNVVQYTYITLAAPDDDEPINLYSHPISLVSPTLHSYIEDVEIFDTLQLAVFVGCKTGDGGPGANNLPTRVVELGAETAIGFKTNISCMTVDTWIENFYNELLLGKTVATAVNTACEATDGIFEIAIEDVTICGNSNLVLSDN